jgi:exopolysaccharide biosynthesis polyprenyl glycosylphosphotransferase
MRPHSDVKDEMAVGVHPEPALHEDVRLVSPAAEEERRTPYAGRMGRVLVALSRLAASPLLRACLLAVAGIMSYVMAYLARGWVEAWDARLLFGATSHPFAYPWLILIILGQLVSAHAAGLFQPLNKITLRRLVARVGLTAILAPLVVLAVQYVTAWAGIPRSVVALHVSLDFALLLTLIVILQRLERRRPERVLLLGPWRETEHFLQALQTLPERSRKIFPDASADLYFGNGASVEEARRLLESANPDRVYLVRSAFGEDHVLRILEAVPERISVFVVPSTWDSLISRLALGPVLGDLHLFEMRSPLADPVDASMKRAMDVAVSAILLVALAPLFALVGLLIKVTSPGRAFYAQERVGRGGRLFRILKFRTMRADAETGGGELLAAPDDPRVTPVGRWLRALRIDELPQLWNVLKGDMSLVGPRPERPGRTALFHGKLPGYDLRHHVRPGITGLAQIYGHYHSHPREKLRFDLAYIYNYTVGLDVAILVRTICRVLTTRSTHMGSAHAD